MARAAMPIFSPSCGRTRMTAGVTAATARPFDARPMPSYNVVSASAIRAGRRIRNSSGISTSDADHHDAEVVEVADQRRLPGDLVIPDREHRRIEAEAWLAQRPAGMEGRELLDDVGAVLLGVAGQHRDQHGDADAGAEIAQQRVDRPRPRCAAAAAGWRTSAPVSGGKTRPSPKPSSTPFQMICASLTFRLNNVMSHSDSADRAKPRPIRNRASMKLIRRATSIIDTIMPAPRGASTMPVVKTG